MRGTRSRGEETVRVQQVYGVWEKVGDIEPRAPDLARIEREDRCFRYPRAGKREKCNSMA
jgi:hypothetical protein